MTTVEGLARRLDEHERHTRRRNMAEMEYWLDQWRQLARDAVAAAKRSGPAVPVAEPNMVWNADDLEEGGYSPDEFADYVAPGIGEESVFEVAAAVSLPNRTMRVWREPDADGHHEVKWEWAGKAPSTDSIPRARLDELLAAEKRVQELMAFLARFENFDPICGTFNMAPDVEEIHAMAEQCRAALAASKEGE